MSLLAVSLAILGSAQALPRRPPPDSLVAAAAAALAHGQPWRASRMLAPVLRDSGSRTPAVLLLAAQAAGAWGGWTEVERLLAGAGWVDSLQGGRGRELLARAALDRQADSVALRHARLAVDAARNDRTRAMRQVLAARALDRLDRRDSASMAYRAAAAALPRVADWLTFRAVALTDDSAARGQLAAAIASGVVRNRLPLAEAEARERAGDLRGAAARYAALSGWTDAYRLRLAADTAPAARAALRAELLAAVTEARTSSQGHAAAVALDAFRPLAPGDELLVGRALADAGAAAAAAAALGRALKAGAGTADDRYAYATALFGLRRYADAAFQYNLVRAPRSLAANAAYARARALVRAGEGGEGRSALREVLRRYPDVTEASATALLLLADLATDERRDAPARGALLSLVRQYPGSRLAPGAFFRAAIIAFAAGDTRTAGRELDSLVRRYPESGEVLAARYWAGRALAATGDSAGARIRWQDVATRDPLSYYAAASEERLGRAPWVPSAAADSFVAVPDVDSALARSELLDSLGMAREARWEQDALSRAADSSVDRLLATAAAFRAHGLASCAVQTAWRAVGRGAARDARTFRLLFPLAAPEALDAYSRDEGLDPAFVAALIRQESIFTPGATSPAGARGLMQLMPAVGHALARAAGFPLWDPVLLYQPDVNLELGTRHLAELVRRYPATVQVLAAYNAGTTRVERWGTKVGMDDEELFAERIPYRETRDYVRIIQRNRQIYRALYGFAAPAGARTGSR